MKASPESPVMSEMSNWSQSDLDGIPCFLPELIPDLRQLRLRRAGTAALGSRYC
jgi:hypothetical protein